jgi:hypothetical protein
MALEFIHEVFDFAECTAQIPVVLLVRCGGMARIDGQTCMYLVMERRARGTLAYVSQRCCQLLRQPSPWVERLGASGVAGALG